MISGIYAIVNIYSEKLYVGNSADLKIRWRLHLVHLNKQNHCNRHLQNAFNKHWTSPFIFVVLEYCEPEKLIEREQYWINLTKCYNNKIGYNLSPTAGSPLGVKRSIETRAKMSASKKGIVQSKESNAKRSLALKGKPLSEKNKIGISKALKGRNFTDTHKLAISKSLKGKILPIETRMKMAISQQKRRSLEAGPSEINLR